MQLLYLISVWIHILAATVWLGGMFFIVLVVVPWLRQEGGLNAGAFLRQTGARFRKVGWVCFGLLSITGTFNLWMRGVELADFARVDWRSSSFGKTVLLKLSVFLAAIVISLVHDFVVGPRASSAIAEAPRSRQSAMLRRRASLLGRINVVLALVLVGLGVMLVRGTPW